MRWLPGRRNRAAADGCGPGPAAAPPAPDHGAPRRSGATAPTGTGRGDTAGGADPTGLRVATASVRADMGRVDADMARLDAAVDSVLVFLDVPLVPRSALVNPLLGVWEAARAIDTPASRPVERLLTAMMTREMVSSVEVTAALDDVRARAIGASVVANCVATSGR